MGKASEHRSDTVVGVLLAGGQARRMGGGDKCMLKLAGRTLLEHVIERLEPQTHTLVLNANGDPARFAAFGRPVVADPVEGFAGPLAGVLAGFMWARENEPDARWVATAATDTPFFPSDLVSRLMEATGGRYPSIALAESGGRMHPVFGLWPTALADDLHDAVTGGTRKVLDWTDRHTTVTAEFSAMRVGGSDIDPFFNANRPDDLTHAEALLAESVHS